MRELFEEYGLVILSTVVIALLIAMAIGLKETEGGILFGIGKAHNEKIGQETATLTAQELIEVEEKVNFQRNKSESALRNYSKIAQQYESEIKNLEASISWVKPIDTSEISASVWTYPESFGGGVHLGVDYAATSGTEIKAPSNGVIVVASDGCSTGFIGDACSGSDENAVSYGGNQIYFLTIVNGKVYAFTFSHLDKNSVHSVGVVSQGTVIGKVGTSGNASGPHSHIEAYYLGTAEKYAGETTGEKLLTIMNTDWTASFGCGWGENALKNISNATTEGNLTENSVVRFNIDILFN